MRKSKMIMKEGRRKRTKVEEQENNEENEDEIEGGEKIKEKNKRNEKKKEKRKITKERTKGRRGKVSTRDVLVHGCMVPAVMYGARDQSVRDEGSE